MHAKHFDLGNGVTAIFVESPDGWRFDGWKGTPIDKGTPVEHEVPDPGIEWTKRRFRTPEEGANAFYRMLEEQELPKLRRSRG